MNGDDPSSSTSSSSSSSMPQTSTATLTASKRRHSRTPQHPDPARKFSVPDAASLQHRRGSSGSLFLANTPQQKRLPLPPQGSARYDQDENSPESSMMDIDDPKPRSTKRTPFAPHDAQNNHPNASQDSLNSSQKSIRSPRSRQQDHRSSRSSFQDHNQHRRTSLPALHLQSPVSERHHPPSPPLPPLPLELVEDIYGGLKSFKFGNASPAGSPSDADQSDENGDVMSPLPRRRSTRKMSRVAVADDHPLHMTSSENDSDEEEKLRQERSKMRAIDDGGRRPSLPINQVGLPSSSLAAAGVSRATLESMSEQLEKQLERRRPSQAISIPRRSSRVSQDDHGKWPGDPHSEPESIRMPWAASTSADAAVEFDMNFILNGSMGSLSCPPSPTGTDMVGDTFLNHITRFDDEYGKRKSNWMLARQYHVLDQSGRPDPREVWGCDFVGKFSILRGIVDPPGQVEKPGKLRANQILIRQFTDIPREARERPRRPSGPSMWIHKHARKQVISIFREYNPFKKEEVMTPAVSILYSPHDLQSFHTRSKPRVQYHDDTNRMRSARANLSPDDHTPPQLSAPLSPPMQEHVYPPSYMGSSSSPLATPRLRPQAPSIVASIDSTEEHPHRRGHADAFSATDSSRLAPTTSALGGGSDAASTAPTTATRSERGTSITERLFKRKGKDKADKVFQPPWLTVQPRQQTEADIERMLFSDFSQWDFPRPSDVTGPATARPSESSFSPLVKPEASSSRSANAQSLEESEEERQRRRVRNLSQSFESVGLIASRKPKASSSSSSRGQQSKTAAPTFLDALPPDSTCFLLPLWPSESASRKHERPRPAYRVPLSERRYLVVYFVQQTQLGNVASPVNANKKRPRQPAANAHEQASSSSKTGFTPFHIVARLLTSDDLLHAGMRSLDKGLFVTGTISDSLLAVPDLSGTDALSPIIIALCNDRQALELVPEGLDKLGLRVEPDDGMSIAGETGPERALTSIGRAVVEIIWAACVAVSSGPAPGTSSVSP